MARASHLVRRFFTSLRGRSPESVDEQWALRALGEGEAALWARMGPTDRAHAIEVARITSNTLDSRDVLAAALMHDVGKIEADAGVPLQVVATLLGPFLSSASVARMARRDGTRGRLGRQLGYPAAGARLLADAGSTRLVMQWAAEHHLPRSRWTIDPKIGDVLAAADEAAS